MGITSLLLNYYKRQSLRQVHMILLVNRPVLHLACMRHDDDGECFLCCFWQFVTVVCYMFCEMYNFWGVIWCRNWNCICLLKKNTVAAAEEGSTKIQEQTISRTLEQLPKHQAFWKQAFLSYDSYKRLTCKGLHLSISINELNSLN